MTSGDNLKNKNVRFNIKNAKKCCALSKRSKQACQAPAMKNGKCRIHGGKSTGARTKEGLKRISKANYRNDRYTKEGMDKRRFGRWFLRNFEKLMQNAMESWENNGFI